MYCEINYLQTLRQPVGDIALQVGPTSPPVHIFCKRARDVELQS